MAKPLKLDIHKFRKVRALMEAGATDGERQNARSRANAIADKACMTLEAAIREDDRLRSLEPSAVNSTSASSSARATANMFEEFFNSPEFQAERAEREARNGIKRAALLKEYGSAESVWAETEQEALLSAAVDHLKEWKDTVVPATGEPSRYVEKLDGWGYFGGVESIPPSVVDAVKLAYPYPDDLAELLSEYRTWDKLYLDRNLFGSFEHWHWVEARNLLIRHDLETKPVRSWQDMHARMDWWQIVLSWEMSMPLAYDQAFRDRVVADLAILQTLAPASPAPVQNEHTQNGRRTNADKAAEVQGMLFNDPGMSDRAIGRAVGVSPQTVTNWRNRLKASAA